MIHLSTPDNPPPYDISRVHACLRSYPPMLPPDFQLDIFPNRAAAASVLRTRATTPPPESLQRWVLTWDRFRAEAFAYIPPPPCFKESDPNWKDKREKYRLKYRHQAVLHFLPHFKQLLPNVTGAHERRVREAIRVLSRWQRDLPDGAKRKLEPIILDKSQFKDPDIPPAIILPMPPTQLKVKRHPTPPPPEPQPAEPDYPRFRAKDQYIDGFESEDWDVLNGIL